MKAFQKSLARLEAADTQVLGVSMDSPFSNFQFAQQNGVRFPILGDWGGDATRKYGLLKKYDISGVAMQSARRATFLIDKAGKIRETQVDRDAIDPEKIVTTCERRKGKG